MNMAKNTGLDVFFRKIDIMGDMTISLVISKYRW